MKNSHLLLLVRVCSFGQYASSTSEYLFAHVPNRSYRCRYIKAKSFLCKLLIICKPEIDTTRAFINKTSIRLRIFALLCFLGKNVNKGSVYLGPVHYLLFREDMRIAIRTFLNDSCTPQVVLLPILFTFTWHAHSEWHTWTRGAHTNPSDKNLHKIWNIDYFVSKKFRDPL